MGELGGSRMKYRVLVSGLTYPTDPRILRRLAAGEDIPLGQRNMCAPHAVGDIVDDLPKAAIAGLIGAGWIEPVVEEVRE